MPLDTLRMLADQLLVEGRIVRHPCGLWIRRRDGSLALVEQEDCSDKSLLLDVPSLWSCRVQLNG